MKITKLDNNEFSNSNFSNQIDFPKYLNNYLYENFN